MNTIWWTCMECEACGHRWVDKYDRLCPACESSGPQKVIWHAPEGCLGIEDEEPA